MKTKMKYWIVKRYLIEEFAIEAETKEEALRIIAERGDPYNVRFIKETAKVKKTTK